MIYFKRKDGSVFGKQESISKKQIEAYLSDGCVKCDENGVVKASKKTTVSKKK